MSLTFRERAAIAMAVSMGETLPATVDPEEGLTAITKGAIHIADALAKAACAEWGHDIDPGVASKTRGFGTNCRRCGERTVT